MSEEFSAGVKIILERIREFPDDFINAESGALFSDHLSWENLVGEIMRNNNTFTKEEQKAVRDALRDMRRARFDGAVMELLAQPAKKKIAITRASSLLVPSSMANQAKKLLEAQFDQEYAKAKPKMEGGGVLDPRTVFGTSKT